MRASRILGYPVDPALRVGLDSRNGVIGARVDLTTVDPDLKSPYVHNWFLGVQRELFRGIVVDANYLGSAGRNLHNAYNINRFTGDLIDGRFDGFNPSFSTITFVTSTSESELSRRHAPAAAQLPARLHAAGRVHVRPGDERRRSARLDRRRLQDAANLPANGRSPATTSPHKLAIVGLVGDAVLQERDRACRAGCWAAGSSPGRRSCRPGRRSTSPTAARSRPATSTPMATAATVRMPPPSGIKTGGWSNRRVPRRDLPGVRFPAPGAGQNGNLVRNAYRGPGYADVSLSLSKKFERDAEGVGRSAPRCVQRLQPRQPRRIRTWTLNSTNFGQIDVAVESASVPDRSAAALLNRGNADC